GTRDHDKPGAARSAGRADGPSAAAGPTSSKRLGLRRPAAAERGRHAVRRAGGGGGPFRAERREPGGGRPPLPAARRSATGDRAGGGADPDPDGRADPRSPG